MSIGDFPGSSSQAILVGIMLVGRLGVPESVARPGRRAVAPTGQRREALPPKSLQPIARTFISTLK